MQESYCYTERHCKYKMTLAQNNTAPFLHFKTKYFKLQMISQQQAVITIINESQHFISDSHSSNGTFVNQIQLTPLKLYELTDDCIIKFAGVSGKYRKVTSTTNFNNIKNANTQNCSESIYIANTQLLETVVEEPIVVNIHDVATQPFNNSDVMSTETPRNELDIHNMPTQFFSGSDVVNHVESHSNDTANIHEIPTQFVQAISDVNSTNNLAISLHMNDDDDDTDVENEDKANKLEQNDTTLMKESLLNPVIEETVLESSNVQNIEQSDESNASLDLMLHDTQNLETVKANQQSSICNTSEGSQSKSTQESTLKVGCLKKSPSCRIKSDDEKIAANNSDSDTDVDTTQADLIQNVPNQSPDSDTEDRLHLSQLRRRTRQLLNSDTEDEAVEECSKGETAPNNLSKINDSDIIPNTQDTDCFTFVTTKEATNTESVNSQQSSGSSIENFKLGLTQFLRTTQSSSTIPQKNNVNDDVAIVDQSNEKTAKGKISSFQSLQKANSEMPGNSSLQNESEEVYLQPTQKITDDDKATTTEHLFVKPAIVRSETEVSEDFYFMPTQKVVESDIFNQQTQAITSATDISTPHDITSQDDEIYALSTQLVCGTDIHDQQTQEVDITESREFAKEKNECQFLVPNVVNDEDMYTMPTQSIFNNNKKNLRDTSNENLSNSHKDQSDDEGIYAVATQRVIPIETTKQNLQNSSLAKKTEQQKASEDIFFAPTQQLLPPQATNDTESQLETLFATQTLAYSDSTCERPGNPLANVFKDIEDQDVDTQGLETKSKSGTENTNNPLKTRPQRKSSRKTVSENNSNTSSANELDATSKNKKRTMRSSKRIKLNTDEELNSAELNSGGLTESRELRKIANVESAKKTTKCNENSVVAEEIKVRSVTKRTRKTDTASSSSPAALVIAADESNNDLMADKRPRRTRKTKSVTTELPLKSADNKKASNKKNQKLSDDITEEHLKVVDMKSDPSDLNNAKSATKRKNESAFKPPTPVKKNKTESLERTLSTSSSGSSEINATPRARGRRATDVSTILSTPEVVCVV